MAVRDLGVSAEKEREVCKETLDVVNQRLQDEFFENAQHQLDGINSFYRG